MQEFIAYCLINGRNPHLLLFENISVISIIVLQLICESFGPSKYLNFVSWILTFIGFAYVASWAIGILLKELISLYFEEDWFPLAILASLAIIAIFAMLLWSTVFDLKIRTRVVSLECACIVALEYLLMYAQKITICSSTGNVYRVFLMESIAIVAIMVSKDRGEKDLIYICIYSALILASYSVFEYLADIRCDMVKGRLETLLALFILPSVVIGYVFLIVKMHYYMIPEPQNNE